MHTFNWPKKSVAATQKLPGGLLVGIAGPPGSGKSTVAENVVRIINESSQSGNEYRAQVICMDWLHYSWRYLDALPNREGAYVQRGASWTFDVAAIVGFIARLQATSSWKRFFDNPSGSKLGIVNAAQSIGLVAILPIVGILSDKIGRWWTLLLGILTIIVASIIQAASINFAMFVTSCVLFGCGGMLVSQPSPMLISELSFPTHRGRFTPLFWLCYFFGAILASWSTYGTQKHLVDSDWAWRGPSVLQAAYPVLRLAFF